MKISATIFLAMLFSLITLQGCGGNPPAHSPSERSQSQMDREAAAYDELDDSTSKD